jgi:trk system potassium uptake protein TrkH
MRNTLTVLLANMGFVLQISGIFVLIPIAASFLLNETDATMALFITAMTFLVLGFITNALCEKKELTYKQSCTLVVAVFITLSIIGSIPYLYVNYINVLNGETIIQHITDSIFESVSGFTTTGFSVIPDLSTLPQSIILYRALTQFIGGIGVVLVLLAFFYPEAKLREFAKSMGLDKNNHKIKKTFLFVVSVYSAFTAIMIAVGYGAGYHNLINLSSLVFSAVSTGGFSPVNDLTPLISQAPLNFILPVCMVFGAINLLILLNLFRKKFKEFFDSENMAFLILAVISTGVLIACSAFNVYDAGFHIISTMSASGFSYLPLASLDVPAKLFLISIMFVGGASFSTAGGIKIFRLFLLVKSVGKSVDFTVNGKDKKMRLFGREYNNSEVIQAATLVFLAGILVFISTFIMTCYGFTPLDALFDSTSAIATAGLSVGIVGPALALELKWLVILLMLLGRVEIMAFLVIFSREKVQSRNNHCSKKKELSETISIAFEE